jgi:hypothetical protein
MIWESHALLVTGEHEYNREYELYKYKCYVFMTVVSHRAILFPWYSEMYNHTSLTPNARRIIDEYYWTLFHDVRSRLPNEILYYNIFRQLGQMELASWIEEEEERLLLLCAWIDDEEDEGDGGEEGFYAEMNAEADSENNDNEN